jgi:hypothetical protein
LSITKVKIINSAGIPGWSPWLRPEILGFFEVDIRKIVLGEQPRQKFLKSNPNHRLGAVVNIVTCSWMMV